MPYKKEDDDDDLFEDDDFEFVDDDDDEEEYEDDDESSEDEDEEAEVEEAPPAKKPAKRSPRPAPRAEKEKTEAPRGRAPAKPRARKEPERVEAKAPVVESEAASEEGFPVEEIIAEPVGPPTDHVVHIYEFRVFKRTIGREFTSEEADLFTTEYNRTAGNHSRWAVAGNKEHQPIKSI
mgnify:FL=1